MTRSIVFVHGTGVREERFAKTFTLVQAALHGIDDDYEVIPAFWGEEAGASLPSPPASIPGYDSSEPDEVSHEDREMVSWSLLYADPWYELGVLARSGHVAGYVGPGGVLPSDALNDRIESYEPSGEFGRMLTEHDLRVQWGDAHASLLTQRVFHRAVLTVGSEPTGHYQVIARALVAAIVANARRDNRVDVGGHLRDQLLKALLQEFDAHAKGLFGQLWDVCWRIAKPARIAGTFVAEWKRASVSDRVAGASADIMLYLTRGSGIRRVIQEAAERAAGERVAVLAHSLGGIASVDALVLDLLPKRVDKLITVGSQAPLLYEINALHSLEYEEPLPRDFPEWLNVYDKRDFLSYKAEGVFAGQSGQIEDVEVNGREPFPESHSAYWATSRVWESIGQFLA